VHHPDDELSDLGLAASLVRDAGGLAARMLRAGLETVHKTSVSDVVSEADRAAERVVVERLTHARPNDGLIGEEGTSKPGGERTWYIDPVDGTYNFLSGLPYWCSALALVDGSGPVLGAVYHPAVDELWLGGRSHPTTCNGRNVSQLSDKPLDQISIATYLHPDAIPDDAARIPLLRVMTGAATVRVLGSGSIELCSVAGGRLGAWVQRNSYDWDWFPGVAMVTAAGGVAKAEEINGHRWHVAGSHQAVEEILTLLRG
jgi:fructose-1,6-bisphosphatase/inositol monophosphatase family enzyme